MRVINHEKVIDLKLSCLNVGDFIFFKSGIVAHKKGMATNQDLEKEVAGFVFDCDGLMVYVTMKDAIGWEIDWDKTIDANYQEARRLEEEKFWAVINKAKEAIKKDKDMKFTSCQNVDCNKEYNFNDLIDVAVKAKKDLLIDVLTINAEAICFSLSGDLKTFLNSEVCKGIEFFESLYAETFVIHSELDIKRVVGGAEILLLNGVQITASKRTYSQSCIIYHKEERRPCERLWIESLKGATVTQKRSINE